MKASKYLLSISLFAFVSVMAHAAGTYYTGNYKSPQNRYNQKTYTTNQGTIYTQGTTYRQGYGAPAPAVNKQVQPAQTQTAQSGGQTNSGLTFGASVSHEIAEWQLNMKQAGSILHYDNIHWNVFDANARYVFGGNTQVQIDAGFRYGMQFGESYMIDDDITKGGYWYGYYEGADSGGQTISYVDVYGHAISTGSSSGGTMMGFNVGLGLTDVFRIGNMRITPSVGYRYLKYKLETKNNYGLSITTADSGFTCITPADSDEIQCEPTTLFYNSLDDEWLGGHQVTLDANGNIVEISDIVVPSTAEGLIIPDTYYYEQPGTSHSYEVEWFGPYLAVDAVYDINQNNSVNARVELGLPGYSSIGDQPYRIDWQHPKSVEDHADMFSGLHLGLGANYITALSDSVNLSIGLTYDYYKVNGADAKTYLNGSYYESVYNALLAKWIANGYTEADMLTYDGTAAGIAQKIKDCPGWVCSADNEIESFYKSMGIRVGLNAKF